MIPFLYGKHPAFGDFLSYGGSGALVSGLDRWLEPVLTALRDSLGDAWTMVWQSAPVLRFWIGPDVLGVPAYGVFLPSRDRVGRIYPLLIGVSDPEGEGHAGVPPTDPRHDETIYDALFAHIAGIKSPEGGFRGGADLLEGLDLPSSPALMWEEGLSGTIWGQRNDGDLARLLKDAAGVEAERAEFRRSHWWHPEQGPRAAGWLACDGLPGVDALGWLFTERLRSPQDEAGAENSQAVSEEYRT